MPAAWTLKDVLILSGVGLASIVLFVWLVLKR